MSAALVLMITDGQDTQKRAEDLRQAGYAIGPAWRRRADRHRKQAINGAATRAFPPIWRQVPVGRHIVRAVPERPFCFANVYRYSPPDHAVVLGDYQEGGLLMSKGYVIFTEDIRDEAGLGVYAQQAIPMIMQAGGRVIVVDDGPELIEGSWHGKRTVVLEFDSVEAARNWYRSPEYQGVVGLRHAAADSNAVIVVGFEMPTS